MPPLTLDMCFLRVLLSSGDVRADDGSSIDTFNAFLCEITELDDRSPFVSNEYGLKRKEGESLTNSLLTLMRTSFDYNFHCVPRASVEEWCQRNPGLYKSFCNWIKPQMCVKNGLSILRQGMRYTADSGMGVYEDWFKHNKLRAEIDDYERSVTYFSMNLLGDAAILERHDKFWVLNPLLVDVMPVMYRQISTATTMVMKKMPTAVNTNDAGHSDLDGGDGVSADESVHVVASITHDNAATANQIILEGQSTEQGTLSEEEDDDAFTVDVNGTPSSCAKLKRTTITANISPDAILKDHLSFHQRFKIERQLRATEGEVNAIIIRDLHRKLNKMKVHLAKVERRLKDLTAANLN